MIRSFRHTGLEKFFKTGSKAGIQPAHASKLNLQLTTLNRVKSADGMNGAGWNLHPLKGSFEGHWAAQVNGNWRLTFRFSNGGAEVVDYQDYH